MSTDDPLPPTSQDQPEDLVATPEESAALVDPPAIPAQPPLNPVQPPATVVQTLKRLLAPVGVALYFVWKFGKYILVAAKSGGLATTALSMIVSIGAYALLWGWKFAVGFVLLMLIHEFGHAYQLRKEGVESSAIVFVPFVGAVIAMKELPRNAAMEARVGIAGPIAGTLGALVFYAYAVMSDSDMMMALAYTGFFLNLFNMIPLTPLDGGRIVAAITPVLWLPGAALLGGLMFMLGGFNPLLIIILVVGGMDAYRRWRSRKENQLYFAVSPSDRMKALAGFIGLSAFLFLMMEVSFVSRDL